MNLTYLFLVRHGTSHYNKKGLWTGLTDVELHPEGIEQAQNTGKLLSDTPIHKVFTSTLKRAIDTFEHMREHLVLHTEDHTQHHALNERDYGTYTGKDKWQVQKEIGDDHFLRIRRGWDVPIPEGESLKQVHDRVVPYYQDSIHPEIKQQNNTLIVAHGNSLRSLMKHLEEISDDEIASVEMNWGEVHCYGFDQDGKHVHKEVKKLEK